MKSCKKMRKPRLRSEIDNPRIFRSSNLLLFNISYLCINSDSRQTLKGAGHFCILGVRSKTTLKAFEPLRFRPSDVFIALINNFL